MSEQKVYFKKKCQINRKKRIGAINISKYLRFICKNGKTKIISPGSASLEDIKDAVKNKLVYGEPEMTPKELNILLSNLDADHLGVVTDTGRVMKSAQPKNALIHDVTDSFEDLQGADVLVLGGSFNGIHKGHRKALSWLFRFMRKNYRQPKIVVLLARDSVIYKKSRERGHASAVFVQTQSERANALAAIPYVSNIILIPENFERNYFDLLLKVNAKVMAVQEGRDQEIHHCQQHQARFANEFQKSVLLKTFPTFTRLSSSSFFSKYFRPTTKDLKKYLELLGCDVSLKNYAPKISTSKEIKDLVRNQIVRGHPDFSPEELNNFLCKLNAEHVGVLCKNKKQKILEPVKLEPAKILDEQEDISSYIENKKVIVSGGCFNGIHKGHRAFFRYIKKTYGENTVSIVLLEASQRIKEKQAYEKHAIQNSEQRADILSKIPGVDLIIKLPHNFKDYLNIIKRLGASVLAACEQEQNTLKYYEKHKAQCQSAGIDLEILKVPTIKTNNTKISSRTFFKKPGPRTSI